MSPTVHKQRIRALLNLLNQCNTPLFD